MDGITSRAQTNLEEAFAMSHSDLVERYAASALRVREAVAGMSPEQILASPIPGRWSTLEVVSHLADFEIIGVDRITAVVAEDSPTLPGRCEQRYAARLHYLERDLEEQLQIIELCRSHATRILRRLTADDWTRPGIHSEAGPLTLTQLLERVVRHVEHHVPFIQAKRAAIGI